MLLRDAPSILSACLGSTLLSGGADSRFPAPFIWNQLPENCWAALLNLDCVLALLSNSYSFSCSIFFVCGGVYRSGLRVFSVWTRLLMFKSFVLNCCLDKVALLWNTFISLCSCFATQISAVDEEDGMAANDKECFEFAPVWVQPQSACSSCAASSWRVLGRQLWFPVQEE